MPSGRFSGLRPADGGLVRTGTADLTGRAVQKGEGPGQARKVKNCLRSTAYNAVTRVNPLHWSQTVTIDPNQHRLNRSQHRLMSRTAATMGHKIHVLLCRPGVQVLPGELRPPGWAVLLPQSLPSSDGTVRTLSLTCSQVPG